VLFAVLFAWLLLAQVPATVQFVGGVLVVAGVALVRIDELRGPIGPTTDGDAVLARDDAESVSPST
jgi:hypothetical protein